MMTNFTRLFIALGTASFVFGMSVVITSGWALYIRCQSLENLYPVAEQRAKANNVTNWTKTWNQMKINWNIKMYMTLSAIGITLAVGLIQFAVATMMIFKSNVLETSHRTLAARFILVNLIIMITLFVCDVTTIDTDNGKVLQFSDMWDDGMIITRVPFYVVLQYGINAFSMFIAFDVLLLFFGMVIMLFYMRRDKRAQQQEQQKLDQSVDNVASAHASNSTSIEVVSH